MKKLILLMFFAVLMVVTAPAWSDSVRQVLKCEQSENTSDSKVEAIAKEWLKAAKNIKGAENLELNLNFPVAAAAGEVDFVMVVLSPSFTEWGAFMDNYHGAEDAKVDDKDEDDVDCGDASLWESVKVK